MNLMLLQLDVSCVKFAPNGFNHINICFPYLIRRLDPGSPMTTMNGTYILAEEAINTSSPDSSLMIPYISQLSFVIPDPGDSSRSKPILVSSVLNHVHTHEENIEEN